MKNFHQGISRIFMGFVFAVMVFSGIARSQTSTGVVNGTVTDPTGAACAAR